MGQKVLIALDQGTTSSRAVVFDQKGTVLAVYGEENKKVNRVASFCGSGADEGSVAFAVRNGADVMISSDYKHHVLALALEVGLSVITLTHYASEEYGFKKYYEKIRQQVGLPCYFHADDLLR